MNDNVRKVFELLGVEPNEKFKLKEDEKIFEGIYYFGEDLCVYSEFDGLTYTNILFKILNGIYTIIKLPKKKKLRDLTGEEWDKWQKKNCDYIDCRKCLFANAVCYNSAIDNSWVNHKDVYSEKFLNQEIEVEE